MEGGAPARTPFIPGSRIPDAVLSFPTFIPFPVMSFDPNFPASHEELASSSFRNQFNALKALIDAMQSQITTLQAQVMGLMNDTPHNCASVGDLSLTLSNPTQSFEVQQLIDKINELMGVLRR